MLLSYNQTYEKIAMGLLSYIADLKEVSRLKTEMDAYLADEHRKLFLWRDEETENIVGVMGVEWDEAMILVRHIAVNPSFRNEGITAKMLEKLHRLYPQHSLSGTLETAPLIAKWVQKGNDSPAEAEEAE